MNPITLPHRCRGRALGVVITLLLAAALVLLGSWLVQQQQPAPPAEPVAADGAVAPDAVDEGRPQRPEGSPPKPIEPEAGLPRLEAAAAYQPKGDAQGPIIEVDISEYAGYGGLIVANGGLDPNPDSFFAKRYGFRVHLALNEGENWSKLNNGRLAATATTADALAVLGRRFEATVPLQIGYSRGADMVVVDRGIGSVNQLQGKVLAASQFNESEFFIRYLAAEAGVPVKVLRDLDGRVGPGELGLVFYEDAFTACDAYAFDLAALKPRLNGCVGWAPRTEEVVEGAAGRAKVLVSNRNLLIVADILAVNRGFAEAHPEMVKGLVHGILEGNRLLRERPDDYLPVIAAAFAWSPEGTREELARVHLANLPENRAFFAGTIDAAGSFAGIYQSSVLAYGESIRNPVDADRFVDLRHLDALAKAGDYADQKVAIAPIRTSERVALEGEALLSKDIRFLFEPNSAQLDDKSAENGGYLDTIKGFLQVSPGSVVLLRGHVDNGRLEEFRKQGGEALVRSMALKAMDLSKRRAETVRKALLTRHPAIDAKRIEIVGRGWEEPVSEQSELNRRVEVQWFTLE